MSCANTSPGNGDSKVVLTLTNSAGQFGSAVTFKVFNPDQSVAYTDYPVANGATTPVTFNGLADGDHSVKILVGTDGLHPVVRDRLRLAGPRGDPLSGLRER